MSTILLLQIIFYFLLWELMLYWIHRVSHTWTPLKKYHWAHHHVVNTTEVKWAWPMIFLYQEDLESTIDLILTDMIPTVIFCAFTGQWWILAWWYIWVAFIQEHIQHNPKFNCLPMVAGKTHLVHHKNSNYNYSEFLPTWDIIFGTYMSSNANRQ